MSGDEYNDLEMELLEEIRPHGNRCQFCAYLKSLPQEERAKWDRILWDGVDDEGELVMNRKWNTQAIQRLAIKRVGDRDFPKSSVENHRKHKHETPTDD